MARPSRSFAATMNRWRILLAAFERKREDFPFAHEEVEELKRLLEAEEEMNVRQEQLKAELMKMTVELKRGLEEGRKRYASLMRYARAKYGPSSLELGNFIPKGES